MGLYDHVWVDDAGKRHADVAIRPNQILVAALPHSPLPRTRLVRVVDAVRRHLLTPFGLRTLSPEDANYSEVDKNKDKIDMLNNGQIPFYEPGLDEIVRMENPIVTVMDV